MKTLHVSPAFPSLQVQNTAASSRCRILQHLESTVPHCLKIMSSSIMSLHSAWRPSACLKTQEKPSVQAESVATSMPVEECAAKSDRNLSATTEYEFMDDFVLVMLVWNLQSNPTINLTDLTIRFRFRPVNQRVARPTTASPQVGD